MTVKDIKVGEAGGISVIDFGAFVDGSHKQQVANAIVQSFKDIGFVYLVNHGLAQEKVDGMFNWSKRFFSQPTDVKLLAPHPANGAHHRGYSAPGVEKVVKDVFDADELKKRRAQAPDVKESFECGREDDKLMPNIWLPDGVLPGFQEACMDFFWSAREVELSILRALALGLGVPEDYFLQYHAVADNQLRLLHYPSVPAERLKNEEITRIGAHTDFCSLTLLFQDNVGGLEVEDPNSPGQFKSATPVEGAVVVNAGDFLQRWSNDTLRSTVHRVRAPPMISATTEGMTPDRYSIPYFCAADFNTVVDCVPTTYSAEHPKKYEPISYIMERLAANY